MNRVELNGMVGKVLTIRGTTHLVLASGEDVLLLLQLAGETDGRLFHNGDPVQYIVAHGPHWYEDELVWRQGQYFPLLGYKNGEGDASLSLRALKAAVEAMVMGG